LGLIRQLKQFPRATQVLLINDLTLNLSFYMIYPFLAVYLSRGLGLATWMVGLTLGIRVFCQQGLAMLGGTLADRFGYKPVLIAGLALRTIGFALFGLVDAFPGVIVAAILTGLAGALFSPAARGYLAVENAGRRAEVFAISSVFTQTGVLLGPLVGAILLGFSFRYVSLAAAAGFLLLAILQYVLLPQRNDHVETEHHSFLNDWKEVLANRSFLALGIAMLAYFTLFNQIYVGLAIEVRRATGSDSTIGILLTTTSLLTIFAQLPVTTFLRRIWRPSKAIALGMTIMAISFAPILIVRVLGLNTGDPDGLWDVVVRLAPVWLSAVLLAAGILIVNPFAMEIIPTLSGDRIVATYFGFYWMLNGLGATVGNTFTGLAFDLETQYDVPGLPWMFLTAIGMLSAAALWRFDRGFRVPEPAREEPSLEVAGAR
jgi:MFS family permease